MDTNVLVSGLLTPFGLCGRIISLVTSGDLRLCVDARILVEYEEVLKRPKFKIDPVLIETLLDFIESTAEAYSTALLKKSLPDPDDNMFLEVAIASQSAYLTTGNLKHFPKKLCCGVNVISPRDLIELLYT